MPVNEAMLEGFLVKPAELRFSERGIPYLSFRVGHNQTRKTADGTNVQDTVFMDVRFIGERAQRLHQYMPKGKHVIVLGRITMDTWLDKETQKPRTKLLILARDVQLMGPAPRRATRTVESHAGASGSGDTTETRESLEAVDIEIEVPPDPRERKLVEKIKRRTPEEALV